MVGARVHIVETTSSVSHHLKHSKGIITAESKNCFYITLDPNPLRRHLSKTPPVQSAPATKVSAEVSTASVVVPQSIFSSSKVVMAVKAECSFAVILPRDDEKCSTVVAQQCGSQGATRERDAFNGGVLCKDDDDGDSGRVDVERKLKENIDSPYETCSSSSGDSSGDIRYDHNAIQDGGKMIILHGSHVLSLSAF
jgi:hypothetical protein